MNKGGRRSKYNLEKFEKLLDEYLGECKDRYRKFMTHRRIDSQGKVYYKYTHKLEANIPTLTGFSLYCKVSRETLYHWARKNEEFHDLIEHLQYVQMNQLVQGGLSNTYNASICILRLKKLGLGSRRPF